MKDLRMLGAGQGVARRTGRRLSAQGVPVCDLASATAGMAIASPIPVLGGTGDSFAYFPPADGTDTLTGKTEGGFPQMVPLSAAAWPPRLGDTSGFVGEAPEVAEDENYPDEHTSDDVIVKHAGVRLLITKDGQLVITAAKLVRIQLESTKELVVSQEDSDTTARLLLAGPMTDAHNGLVDVVNDLKDRVQSLETALITLQASLTALGATASVATPSVQQMPKPSLTYKSAASIDAVDVAAAALRVSAQTVAQSDVAANGD